MSVKYDQKLCLGGVSLHIHYFNVTYRCNNRCYFCASDSPSEFLPDLTVDEIRKSIAHSGTGPGDMAVVNGGEPTVHPHLREILEVLVDTGAYVVLFTNGRKLADPAYAMSVLRCGLSRISVPLYGYDATTHDDCTGIGGSWHETVEGLHNVFRWRESMGTPEVELKTLITDRTIGYLPRAISTILRMFPSVDRFVLSGLIQSDTALASHAAVDLGNPQLLEQLNRAVMEALQIGSRLILDSVPLCVLNPDVRIQWLFSRSKRSCARGRGQTSESYFVYADAKFPEGIKERDWWNISHCPHEQCRLHSVCRMNPRYFRSPIAASGIRPIVEV